MGLFDFLKSNKNIITDNGTNFIYENDGKVKLKEKFFKVNGILNGEYLKYDESGNILSTDYYHNGHIISIEEKQRIDDEKRRIENSKKEKTLKEYKNKICKLIEIDKTIFDVAYGNLIVQMTNATLLDFSRELSTLFQDYFEEEFFKIYLFYKRNYLINKLISFKDDEINLNQIFTEYLNSKKKDIDYEISIIGVYRPNMQIHTTPAPHKQIIEDVFYKLRRTFNNSNLITSLSLDSFNVLDKSNNITNQDCELIGLEIDGYITINNTIKSIQDKIDDIGFGLTFTQYEKIKDKIYKDIIFICKQYKFYQGGIEFNLENLNVQNLIKLSEINNLSAFEFYERAKTKHYELNDYSGAMDDFNKSIEINPNFSEAFFNRGILKKVLEDYQGALDDYNTAIELDDNSEAYRYRAGIKKINKDYNGAINDFNIAVEKYPEDDSSFYGRGELKYGLADYNGAIKDFNKSIEIKPKRIMSFHKRGDCKLIIEDYKGAIEDYSIVIKNRQYKYGLASPPSENATKLLASLYYNRGFARSKIKEYEEAIEDLNKAIDLDPNCIEEVNVEIENIKKKLN
jgi:tetratricopeptide (TPR) repeat protein